MDLIYERDASGGVGIRLAYPHWWLLYKWGYEYPDYRGLISVWAYPPNNEPGIFIRRII